MDLTSRLRQLLPQASSAVPAPKKSVDLDPLLGGTEVETPLGPCYLVTKQLPLAHRHGNWPLSEVYKSAYTHLARFAPGGGDRLNLERALFLDTETTGLAGGTGTYAFLVGLGYFTPDSFVVKQVLMRDYNEELALLHVVDQELGAKDAVISFNGRTFDLPLLQTRFALARLGFQGASGKVHYDLLPMSRRLWKYKLSSCSLNSLEEHLLGVQRSGDIPGYEIPQRYFDFLHTGQGRLLQDIVEHNFLDIVSMASLLFRIQTVLELEPSQCHCPYEAEALARLALQNRAPSLALDYLHRASELAREDELYLRILRQQAALLKRTGQHGKAAVLWKEILSLSASDLSSAEELAKYYEHRAKDLQAARQITKRALALAWAERSPLVPALEHRLNRIEGKLRRQAAEF
ncbi:MAG: ribonuclease H-like domain-containing protein [Limnochordia bacterium]|jgi:uncharacterized protein YprB with RNaseH-like and TPR domain|nr:ribonuclease H-like domain-containing protein [Bacillota bacterium]NLL08582.1 hypothetical protein [Bacillota bacterium]HBG09414.1 hypothetical protein [Bacillota bacterium]